MKSSTLSSQCSEKCRFSENCKISKALCQVDRHVGEICTAYLLCECLPGCKNEYGLEENSPLYSIIVSCRETGECRRLCCLTKDGSEAELLFKKLSEGAVTPYEADEVLIEYQYEVTN